MNNTRVIRKCIKQKIDLRNLCDESDVTAQDHNSTENHRAYLVRLNFSKIFFTCADSCGRCYWALDGQDRYCVILKCMNNVWMLLLQLNKAGKTSPPVSLLLLLNTINTENNFLEPMYSFCIFFRFFRAKKYLSKYEIISFPSSSVYGWCFHFKSILRKTHR